MNREFLIDLMVIEDDENATDINNQVKFLNRAIKENILSKRPQESGFQSDAKSLLNSYRNRNPRYNDKENINRNSLEFEKIYERLYDTHVFPHIKPVPITVKSDVRKTKIDLAKRKAKMAGKKYVPKSVGVKGDKKELAIFKLWLKNLKEEEQKNKSRSKRIVQQYSTRRPKMITMSSVPKPRSELVRRIAKQLVDKAKTRKKGEKSELEKRKNEINKLKIEIEELKKEQQRMFRKMKHDEKMKELFNYDTALNRNYPDSMNTLRNVTGPFAKPKKRGLVRS